MALHLSAEKFLPKRSDYRLIDVRTTDEWAEHHESCAMHLPLDEIEARIREISKGKPLAVVCRTGGRGLRACGLLASAGFEAYNISGGLKSLLAEKKRLGLIGDKEYLSASEALG